MNIPRITAKLEKCFSLESQLLVYSREAFCLVGFTKIKGKPGKCCKQWTPITTSKKTRCEYRKVIVKNFLSFGKSINLHFCMDNFSHICNFLRLQIIDFSFRSFVLFPNFHQKKS